MNDLFAIYVHWPFCAAKCPYCDFNSHVRREAVDQARFARALVREMEWTAQQVPSRTVTSVFFGGGTPSLMEVETIGTVLEAVARLWPVADDAEVTLEANPTSVEAERFRGYRAAGVNRVSLGVQSLRDAELKRLGRLHDAAEARSAIGLARETFSRMSFDLIYARPDQTVAAWETELREAIDLAADHLSLYQLTIEPGTPFFDLEARGRLRVPDEGRAADLFEATRDVTAAHGLYAYEVSNHARLGDESRHNIAYWTYAPYLGIGAGAHGRWDVGGTRIATRNHALPERWLEAVERDGHGLAERTVLTREEAADETLVMGLRLARGLDVPAWEREAGRRLDPARITALAGDGLIERNGERLRATPSGTLVLNALIGELAA